MQNGSNLLQKLLLIRRPRGWVETSLLGDIVRPLRALRLLGAPLKNLLFHTCNKPFNTLMIRRRTISPFCMFS